MFRHLSKWCMNELTRLSVKGIFKNYSILAISLGDEIFLKNVLWIFLEMGRVRNERNLVQNIADKFTKLNKIDLFMECFTTDLMQFSSTSIKIYLLCSMLGTHDQFQAFQWYHFIETFLFPKVLSCLVPRDTTCKFFFWLH